MTDEAVARADWRGRVSHILNRAELIYLRVLRALILVIATLMVAYAVWLGLSSAYKLSRSPDSVVQETAVVAADEITNAEMSTERTAAAVDSELTASPEQRQFYTNFVARYYNLFRTRFEPFRQPEDKRLTRDEFDDAFIDSQTRLRALPEGDLDFTSDREDLNGLYAIMEEAASRPITDERLRRYQAAKKVRVERKVQRTRTEYRRGWDSMSTACSDWFYSPIGCPVQRPVQVPYTATVAAMEFPTGTQSHTQIFRAFQDRYFELLNDRRESNARKAQNERDRIMAGRVEGGLSLVTAVQVVGAFLLLMFFFLLIAIERHQRRIAYKLDAG